LVGRTDATAWNMGWEELPRRLEQELRVDISGDLVVGEYRRLYPGYSASDVFFAATTAGRSWRGAIIEAERRAEQGSPAYVYQLDSCSPEDVGKWVSCHTLDIPLMFGTRTAHGSLTGAGEQARRVSSTMQQALLALGRTGGPNNPE